MEKIINEFFSKDSKIQNKTIEELLEAYGMNETTFWNGMHNDVENMEKIKQENECRKRNKRIIKLINKFSSTDRTVEELLEEYDVEEKDFWEYVESKSITYPKIKEDNNRRNRRKVLKIINEFFSKDSKIQNKTIEELLEAYGMNETTFWNGMYNDVENAKKIKKENERRKKNVESLAVYRLTKDGKTTFGDIARMKQIKVEEVIALLQNDYLKGIHNYSFEHLQLQNLQLLKQREQFQLYFEYINQDLTFRQLAEQSNRTESEIIYFFDSMLLSESTEAQINDLFTRNKRKEQNIQRRQDLFHLFALTEEEMKSIDAIIGEFQKISVYQKRVEVLNDIKSFLTSNPSMADYCQFDVNSTLMEKRLAQPWLEQRIMPSIFLKLSICNLITTERVYTGSKDSFFELKNHMELYAQAINDKTIFQDKMRNRWKSKKVDQNLKICIFSKIENVIQKIKNTEKIVNFGEKVFEHYLNHFILFRDLGHQFHIEPEELEHYYNSPRNKEKWKQICEIEQYRNKILADNISLILEVSQVLNQLLAYQKDKDSLTKFRLEEKFHELVKDKITISDLCKQESYIMKFIRSMQFTILYLLQEGYDVKNLKDLFDIKSPNTVVNYLYHPLTNKLLDSEIYEYIREKRTIAADCQRYQNYESLECDEKGQFVKNVRFRQ